MHGKFAQTIVGGTPCYMVLFFLPLVHQVYFPKAPELLYKEKYDTKSDIWSLGCMIWELACRCLLSQNKGVLGAQVRKRRQCHGSGGGNGGCRGGGESKEG
eukprot:767253-Hanusia_phi.AAC.2